MIRHNRVPGIALIQVLLMSTIIAVLLIIAVSHTQQQQQQVLALTASVKQQTLLYSQSNALIYKLLSHPLAHDAKVPDPVAARWNFLGEDFAFGETTVRLFNLPSLVNLQADSQALINLLMRHGKGQTEAAEMAKQVRIRQQPFLERHRPGHTQQRVLPLQHFAELALLPGWDRDSQRRVMPYLAMVPYEGKAEAYLPSVMLDLVFSTTKADMIRTSRQQALHTAERFYALAGIEPDEFTLLSPGPYLRLELRCCTDAKGQQQRRQVDIEVRPYDMVPLQILSIVEHQ